MKAVNVKRILDLSLSVPAFIISIPIQAAVAIAIVVRLGRPVLFWQERVGQHGCGFMMVKFRTMRPIDLSRGWDDDASRITGLGRILRAASLDELPSLWNILRGDMSLVGPRPLLIEYLERYSPAEARRHDIRPGLTGLAQISGRNALTWEEKFALDLTYVETQSIQMDLRILFASFRLVLSGKGVHANGQATMTEFQGTSTKRDAL